MLTAVSAALLCSDPLKKGMPIPQAARTPTRQHQLSAPCAVLSRRLSIPGAVCIPSPVDFGVQRPSLLALSKPYSCPVSSTGAFVMRTQQLNFSLSPVLLPSIAPTPRAPQKLPVCYSSYRVAFLGNPILTLALIRKKKIFNFQLFLR